MKCLDALTMPLWGSRLIEASAGTGKTWTVATLYLRLILGHGEAVDDAGDAAGFARALTPPEILVMTFTKAATRELSERIRDRLLQAMRCFRGQAAVPADDRVLAALLASFPDGQVREAAAWRLATAAEGMDDAAVYTIDAWVQRMLREHAFDSGSLFDEEVQPDEAGMLAEATRDYWRQQVYPLDASALAGVLDVWADPVALAKDVLRLKRYVDGRAPDRRSLADVWAAEAAGRLAALAGLKEGWSERVGVMREWVEGHLASRQVFNGVVLKRPVIAKWLDEITRWAGAADTSDLKLSDAAIHRLSPAGLREALKEGVALDIPGQFDALRATVDALGNFGPPGPALRRHAAVHVAARLRELKRRAGAYGFDDMLDRLEAALAGPGGDRLRERIVAQYPVSLIDEFQDTSPVQYRIFDRLYRIADNDRATALLLIGDPKQAIYSFRGADIQSYLKARASTADRHYLLTTNHRSSAPLVAVVNRLFEAAETRAAGAFRFASGAMSGDDGPLPFVPVDARGRTDAYCDADGPIAALTVCHDAELLGKRDLQRRFAANCAEHIASALDDANTGFVDPSTGFVRLRPADITVLVRDRFEGAAIRRALQWRHIASVYLSDQDSVFHSPEADDLRHWLQAVADPMNGRLARIAYATRMVDLPLADLALPVHDDGMFERRTDDLKRLNDEWRRLGILAMLRRTLHLLDLPARWLRMPDGERRLTNVLHLAELLQQAGARLDGEQALIRWLEDEIGKPPSQADEEIVRLESDADLVRVVTIHKAKGLEYPVVYLPFACSHREKKWEDDAVVALAGEHGERTLSFDVGADEKARAELETQQEDVRLLYVALTRARHALWLGVAPPTSYGNCSFGRSAFGYLLSGGDDVDEHGIAGRIDDTFAALPSVRIVAVDADPGRTVPRPLSAPSPLVEAPRYEGRFERDWAIGSFSAFVHDLARVPLGAVAVAPAVEDEVLSDRDAAEDAAPPSASEARHRFPRGALVGNFLHDQLEWLATQRFMLSSDASRDQLMRRCDRQGWGPRAADVVSWMSEVVCTPLRPVGVALNGLSTILSEMEFWFPSEGMDARFVDALCREHLLDEHERPALPERTLRGMLKGFTDLVFEHDGRYWVLDYKSNALGADDAAYTHEALASSMAAHRYDVQATIYLLALHRLLRQRLGDRYEPERQLGGALFLFIRGMQGPAGGCYAVEARLEWLDALDRALQGPALEVPSP